MTISIIAIEGEDCGIGMLGKLAQDTSGTLTIVKPLELQRKMRQIIDNPVIATGVTLKVFTHPIFGFSASKTDETKDKKTKQSETVYTVKIGNVTALSDLAIDFSSEAWKVSTFLKY